MMVWCVWVCVLQKLNIGVRCQMQVWVVVCRFLEWMYVLGGGGGGGLACVYQLIIQTKKIFENFWIMLEQKINKSRMMKHDIVLHDCVVWKWK